MYGVQVGDLVRQVGLGVRSEFHMDYKGQVYLWRMRRRSLAPVKHSVFTSSRSFHKIYLDWTTSVWIRSKASAAQLQARKIVRCFTSCLHLPHLSSSTGILGLLLPVSKNDIRPYAKMGIEKQPEFLCSLSYLFTSIKHTYFNICISDNSNDYKVWDLILSFQFIMIFSHCFLMSYILAGRWPFALWY